MISHGPFLLVWQKIWSDTVVRAVSGVLTRLRSTVSAFPTPGEAPSNSQPQVTEQIDIKMLRCKILIGEPSTRREK
jgi:hypothetical protein